MKLPFHTLRWRLALWYGLSLAVVLSLFGSLLYGIVRYQLIRHHDRALTGAATMVAKVLSERDDWATLSDAQRGELDRLGHLVLVHQVDGEGRELYRSPEAGALDVPAVEVLPRAMTHGQFETLKGQRELLRMYSEPYRARSGRQGVIRIVHGLGDVPAPLASVRLALLLMTPLSVLFAVVGGYWLAARALAPVDDVTRLARDIGASNLGRRLPTPRVEDEIGRLVETFNAMISRLESSFEAMRRFTADASHELRGPLATMRGAIDVTLARPRDAEDYRRALLSVGEDVDRLRSIAEDLLVLARADAGRIVLEKSPLRLDVLACEVLESFRGAATDQGVALRAGSVEAIVVAGDERWLRQLVYNLVDNAVKFSSAQPSAPAPQVTLDVARSGRTAVLRVADTGPGIPEHLLARIFERFFRLDDARSLNGREGFGLGLSIASWITEAHGGTIQAANQGGEPGAVVSVTLPLAES